MARRQSLDPMSGVLSDGESAHSPLRARGVCARREVLSILKQPQRAATDLIDRVPLDLQPKPFYPAFHDASFHEVVSRDDQLSADTSTAPRCPKTLPLDRLV